MQAACCPGRGEAPAWRSAAPIETDAIGVLCAGAELGNTRAVDTTPTGYGVGAGMALRTHAEAVERGWSPLSLGPRKCVCTASQRRRRRDPQTLNHLANSKTKTETLADMAIRL
jgi:hypothetical protein